MRQEPTTFDINSADAGVDPAWLEALETPVAPPLQMDLADAGAFDTTDELPTRVPFTMPLYVRREGETQDVAGIVVNLSQNGIAATLAGEHRVGERVWNKFRLNLAEEPVVLLSEVLWRKSCEQGWLYGFRFAGLTRDESLRIAQTVSERRTGIAGDFPLPNLESAFAGEPASQRSTLVAGCVGLVTGVVMTGLVGTLMYLIQPTMTTEPTAVAQITTDSVVPTAGMAEIGPATVLDFAADVPNTADVVTTEAADPSSLLPRLASTPEERLTAPKADILRPVGSADGLTLGLLVDSAATYEHFWLDNPRRLVVDVPAAKSQFQKAQYDVDHALIRQLRIGQHKDKVRFVLETEAGVEKSVKLEAKDGALLVTLKAS